MPVAGIISEYNPFHKGHRIMIRRVREILGPDTAVVCVMSGNFVQRGDFAVTGRLARAEAAVRSGADLVLELPLPWAVSSAEGFAQGGVSALASTGLVTHLAFGCTALRDSAFMETAACLNSERYQTALRQRLQEGRSYAACRQAVVQDLLGPLQAALLDEPNNNLGVEYCRALLRTGSAIQPLAIRRTGAGHDGDAVDGIASGSHIRKLLRAGSRALSFMAPAMAEIFQREEAAGRAPVFWETCQRAILAQLRSMPEASFAALDQGKEGLYHRLYKASRTAATLPELLKRTKTKRYAYARLRRMVLWAWLGLRPDSRPDMPPCLRVLAANRTGQTLLAQMRRTAQIPILTKPAAVRKLSQTARTLFALEARATDLYTLAYPDLTAAVPGGFWREKPRLC